MTVLLVLHSGGREIGRSCTGERRLVAWATNRTNATSTARDNAMRRRLQRWMAIGRRSGASARKLAR